MLEVVEIKLKDSKRCYELDLGTLNLWNHNQWVDELSKKHTKAYGIFDSNKIIGVCVFQIIFNESELRFIAINKDHKRKGLGGKLISKLISQCKQKKIDKIFLEVSNKNKAALKFYDHIGFKTVGIRKNFYRDGSDALVKEKKC